MKLRATILTIGHALLLLLVIACGTPEAGAAPDGVDTSPRDVSGFGLLNPRVSGAMFEYEIPTVEGALKDGLYGAGAAPTHIAIRGTPVANSARCAWQGVVRTNQQRTAAVRYILNLADGVALPSTADQRTWFASIANQLVPEHRDAMQANFDHLVDGGVLVDGRVLVCYVDYSVSEYLLGGGLTSLTVAYGQLGTTESYSLYVKSHAAGAYGGTALQTNSDYAATQEQTRLSAETDLHDMVNGRESVIFLAPMGDHSDVAVEAWQVVAQWDVQTKDGAKHAVRYGAHDDDPGYSQTLANLKTRVTTAAASDTHAGQRIANTSGLTQHYRDMGAYEDITPNDGEDTSFVPLAPPAMPACATGAAVSAPTDNRGLMWDCSALLAGHDTLKGSGTGLNWSNSLALAGWTGITLSQTPQRVTAVSLGQSNLAGTIPQELAGLTALGALDLSNNSLTGEIPAGLADLPLNALKLAGNQLTGCIPAALRDISTHDLDQLGLLYCDATAPAQVSGVQVYAIYPTWTAFSWDRLTSASAPVTGYRIQSKLGDGAFEDVASGVGLVEASYSVSDLTPNTEYTFRVAGTNAIGDGEWSVPFSVTTSRTTPGRITETSAHAQGETSITVRWQAPRDHGSEITSYMIQHRALPSTTYLDVATVPATGTLEYLDTGLTRKTAYVYRIKAVNELGRQRTGPISPVPPQLCRLLQPWLQLRLSPTVAPASRWPGCRARETTGWTATGSSA